MIIDQPGRIAERLYMLGSADMPVYLLDGARPVIFDSGFAFMADLYIQSIKAVLGERQPAYCLLTHSHFDHLGSTAYLKEAFPGMRIGSSAKVASILKRPNAVDTISFLTAAAVEMVKAEGYDVPSDKPFRTFDVDMILEDYDQLSIDDGLDLIAMTTPGHTRDMLSYYAPQIRTIFAGEAAGIRDHTGYIFCDFLVEYGLFCESLDRLAALDCETLCLGHYCALSGEDARSHLLAARRQSRDFLRWVMKLLEREEGDMLKVSHAVRAVEYDAKQGPKQPEPAYMLNLEARMKAVQNHIHNHC